MPQSLKNILGPYKVLAPILFCCGIYFWAQDSFKTMQLHRRRFDLLLEGISIEKKSPSCGTFFKQALQGFSLKNIILKLSIAGILSLGAFGYCLFEFLKESIPTLLLSYGCLIPLVAHQVFKIARLYKTSLKDASDAKIRAL